MSVEGLLSEVSALLGARLNIAAADQAFFGGKRVFSDVSAAASTSAQQQKSNEKCGKKCTSGGDELQSAISNAKQIADRALAGHCGGSAAPSEEICALKKDQKALKADVETLTKLVASLQTELNTLKKACAKTPCGGAPDAAPAKKEEKEDAGGDDFDLFGSDDEEDDEKKKIVEERLKEYAEKKSKKPGPIAKSSVILDVKPWDDETNMQEMESLVRSIEMDGLVWGGAKLLPIGYGIKKLQVICVIEDLKVSVDDLIEKITTDFESHVQSVDIAAFNKI